MSYTALLFFGLGIFTQLILTLSRKRFRKSDFRNLLAAVGMSLFIAAIVYLKFSEEDLTYTPDIFIFTSIISFAVIVSFLFIDRILPQINELVLIVWNVGFWYLYLLHFSVHNFFNIYLLVPTVFSLGVAIFTVRLHYVVKVILYVWFMIMAVSITLMFAPWQGLSLKSSSAILPLELFFLGMTFFYTFSCFLYVIYFIPIPDKSFKKRSENIEAHARLLSTKYNDTQYHPLVMVLVLTVIIGVIYTNHRYKFVDEKLLLMSAFALSPMLGEKLDALLKKDPTTTL